MKNLIFCFFAFLLLFIVGCVSPAEELPLLGKTYKFSDSKGHVATVTFNRDNTMNGFSGVNRFFGEFRTASDMIAFANMGSTKMAGHPEAMKFEDKFIKILSKTNRFYEIGRNLTLFNGDMPLATLKLTE